MGLPSAHRVNFISEGLQERRLCCPLPPRTTTTGPGPRSPFSDHPPFPEVNPPPQSPVPQWWARHTVAILPYLPSTGPHDGAIVQKHLHAFLKVLRRLFGPSLRYLWVLEFQWANRPGVPHYHVFLSVAAAPGSDVHHKMATAWVRITQGSPEQYRVHASPKNWKKWVMNDGVYITKNYMTKKEQKEVPAHYQNVGRFWGCSRNFVPVPTIIEPETIAPWSAGWAPDQVERTIVRTLRRYHERCMNYDRQSWTKRAGRKHRRSPLRQGDTNGAHSIPFAAPILYQLLDYMAEHSPTCTPSDGLKNRSYSDQR